MGVGSDEAWHEITLLSIVADETGLTQEEIWDQVQVGNTLAEVISANGSRVEAVVEAYEAARTAVLDEWLASGRITEYQYDTMLAHTAEEAEEHLNSSTWCGMGSGNMSPRVGMPLGRGGQRGRQMPGSWLHQDSISTTRSAAIPGNPSSYQTDDDSSARSRAVVFSPSLDNSVDQWHNASHPPTGDRGYAESSKWGDRNAESASWRQRMPGL